jgi:hypothetical protein
MIDGCSNKGNIEHEELRMLLEQNPKTKEWKPSKERWFSVIMCDVCWDQYRLPGEPAASQIK